MYLGCTFTSQVIEGPWLTLGDSLSYRSHVQPRVSNYLLYWKQEPERTESHQAVPVEKNPPLIRVATVYLDRGVRQCYYR